MSQFKVGILGGAGYTGGELLRILLQHPAVSISFVDSESQKGLPLHSVHQDLLPLTDLKFSAPQNLESLDVLFFCGGHGRTASFLDQHSLPPQIKLIDLSHDYRTDASWVYGLPELYHSQISEAQKIANPGCFATTIQLALLPLIQAGALEEAPHVTAVTGSTGAGQSPQDTTHFSWRSHNISVYKAFSHQHLKEMQHHLGAIHPKFDGRLNFIPMRGSFPRGILASVHLLSELTGSAVKELYQEYYAAHPFTVASPYNPDLKQVLNTNYCFVHVEKYGDQLHIVSCLDNLLKGASGQAVENMNLMLGLPQNCGLQFKPVAF
ncbi:MAG: N-acetyl-gamma-glutamyl-phosphate reductase [Oligoflexus sp.]